MRVYKKKKMIRNKVFQDGNKDKQKSQKTENRY